MGDYDSGERGDRQGLGPSINGNRQGLGPSINMDIYLRPGGAGGKVDGKPFCNAAHPTRDDVWCRRQPDHDERDTDGHAAFVHSIREPEYWESA